MNKLNKRIILDIIYTIFDFLTMYYLFYVGLFRYIELNNNSIVYILKQ